MVMIFYKYILDWITDSSLIPKQKFYPFSLVQRGKTSLDIFTIQNGSGWVVEWVVAWGTINPILLGDINSNDATSQINSDTEIIIFAIIFSNPAGKSYC